MCNELFDKCRELAAAVDSQAISKAVERAEALFSAEHKLNVTFASTTTGGGMLLTTVRELCGDNICDTYFSKLTGKSFTLKLTYAENEKRTAVIGEQSIELTDDNINAVMEETKDLTVIHEAPLPFLKNTDITLSNGIYTRKDWRGMLESTNLLILITSAMMALPSTERGWISEYVEPLFGRDRFAVVVKGIELLNSEEECADLISHVEKSVSGIGEEIKIYIKTEELKHRIEEMTKDADGAESARKRLIAQNLLNEIKISVEELLAEADTNIAEAVKAARQLESKRAEIEAAGRVTAETMVRNIYSDVKFQAIEAVDEYSCNAENSIVRKMETSENPTELSKEVGPYLEGVWKSFEANFVKTLAAVREDAMKQIMERIEFDTGDMIKGLDVGTIDFIDRIVDRPDVMNWWMPVGNKGDRAERVKKISRNIMLAAIPVFVIVNPISGIATLVGSQIYKRSQRRSIIEEERAEVIQNVRDYCGKIKAAINASVTDSLSSEEARTAENVRNAYSSVIDNLIGSIDSFAGKMTSAKEKRNVLETALNEQLPAMINNL